MALPSTQTCFKNAPVWEVIDVLTVPPKLSSSSSVLGSVELMESPEMCLQTWTEEQPGFCFHPAQGTFTSFISFSVLYTWQMASPVKPLFVKGGDICFYSAYRDYFKNISCFLAVMLCK